MLKTKNPKIQGRKASMKDIIEISKEMSIVDLVNEEMGEKRFKAKKRKKPQKKPTWKFGISFKSGRVHKLHSNGKPYYYPV